MADELGIITVNEDEDSWVDLVPDEVSTGYQAQNTNIEANRNGVDLSYVYYDSGTDEIVIDPSGPIDDNGLPFSVDSEIRFSNPGAGIYFLRVIPGSTDLLRSLEITSSKGTWDGSKNGLYDGSNRRVLNWVLLVATGDIRVNKLIKPMEPTELVTKIIDIGDWLMQTNSGKNVTHGISDISTIRRITCIIRNNSGSSYNALGQEVNSDADGDGPGGITGISSTVIFLARVNGKAYDSASYEQSSYNRGWVTVEILV